ncbi:DUF6906 family protein [Paenibacillus psychroresistens]|uniref:DUF6906 family protein n=1 Tax=Paenibacillus psychroresistens TaxID=1778678 RepID=UPI001877B450|nr:hypothetical protein [Paenibacillus psychroresistens]
MKHGLNPTRRQKIAIEKAKLNYNNWLIVKNVNKQLHIQHRQTGSNKVIAI